MRVSAILVLAIIGGVARVEVRPAGQAPPSAPPAWATKDLRAGIIGTDTSHVPAFTAAVQQDPPRVADQGRGGVQGRQPRPADQRRPGREVRGKTIQRQARRRDRRQHRRAARRRWTSSCWRAWTAGRTWPRSRRSSRRASACSSTSRWPPAWTTPAAIVAAVQGDRDAVLQRVVVPLPPGHRPSCARPPRRKATKVQASSPFSKLAFHPDLYFYGIHGVEALYAVMGPGCVERVPQGRRRGGRHHRQVEGRPGRRLPRAGRQGREAADAPGVGRGEGTTDVAGAGGYDGLVRAVAEFFHTGKPPVDPARDAGGVRVHDRRPAEPRAGRGRGAARGRCGSEACAIVPDSRYLSNRLRHSFM